MLVGDRRLGDLVIMIVARDIDPGRPARRALVERIEQHVRALAIEFLDESARRVIDDRTPPRFSNAVEHAVDEVGLACTRRATQKDMFGFEGFRDRDIAYDQRSLALPPECALHLPDGTEAGAAQIFVGAKAPARPREVEPGPSEHGEGEQAGDDRTMEQIDFEAVQCLLRKTRGDQPVRGGPVGSAFGRVEQHRIIGAGGGIDLDPGFGELDEDKAFIGAGLFKGVPERADDPDHHAREQGLVEDLGRHPDIVDNGLTATGPTAERIVAEDAHYASSPPSNPRSARMLRACAMPCSRAFGDCWPTEVATIERIWIEVARISSCEEKT